MTSRRPSFTARERPRRAGVAGASVSILLTVLQVCVVLRAVGGRSGPRAQCAVLLPHSVKPTERSVGSCRSDLDAIHTSHSGHLRMLQACQCLQQQHGGDLGSQTELAVLLLEALAGLEHPEVPGV